MKGAQRNPISICFVFEDRTVQQQFQARAFFRTQDGCPDNGSDAFGRILYVWKAADPRLRRSKLVRQSSPEPGKLLEARLAKKSRQHVFFVYLDTLDLQRCSICHQLRGRERRQLGG